MWIVRDKDGTLWLFTYKPQRCTAPGWDHDSWEAPNLVEDDGILNGMEIDPNLFPEVTWEDEPICVELVKKYYAK